MAKTNGNCFICGETLTTRGVKNHILKYHNGGDEECYLFKAEGTYNKNYWIYFTAPFNATFDDIDKFLRQIWCECCNHMSEFHMIKQSPVEVSGVRIPKKHVDVGMARKVRAMSIGDVIEYEYDFGSTTEITLTVADKILRRPQKGKKGKIQLLVRNIMPEEICELCGGRAAYIDIEENRYVCAECADAEADLLLPIVNSPRCGECGYTSELDKWTFNPEKAKATANPNTTNSAGTPAGGGHKRAGAAPVSEDEAMKIANEMTPKDIVSLLKRMLHGTASEQDKALIGGISGLTEDIEQFKLELEESREEIAVPEVLQGLMEKFTLNAKPTRSLRKIIGMKSVKELKTIAKEMGLDDCEKLKKPHLVQAIYDELIENGVRNVIEIIPEDALDLTANISLGILTERVPEVFVFPTLLKAFIIAVFAHEGKTYCVIPEEIDDVLEELMEDNDFLEIRDNTQLWGDYAQAAVNLYGIFPIAKLTEKFKSDGYKFARDNAEFDEAEAEKKLWKIGASRNQFLAQSGYVFSAYLFDPETNKYSEQAAELIKNNSDKPYFSPQINENDEDSCEFWEYENIYCSGNPDENEALETLLTQEIGLNDYEAEMIVSRVIFTISAGMSDENKFLSLFEEMHIELTAPQKKKARKIFANMFRTTRKWVNNGFTDEEMG